MMFIDVSTSMRNIIMMLTMTTVSAMIINMNISKSGGQYCSGRRLNYRDLTSVKLGNGSAKNSSTCLRVASPLLRSLLE
jgi:hypothetical protein